MVTAFENNMDALVNSLEELQAAYNEQFLSATSAYNVAKQAYIDAKEALLAKRLELAADGISGADKAVLEGYEDAVEDAMKELEINSTDGYQSAKELAERVISTARDAVEDAFTLIKQSINQLKTLLASLGVNLDALNDARQQAREDFKTHFELLENFGGYVGHDKGYWSQPSQQK